MEEVEEKISELTATLECLDELEVESVEERKIVAYGYKILVPSLDIYMREGAMLMYDEDEEDWYADFSLTQIYNSQDGGLYWEQDGVAVSLYNFFNAGNHAESMEKFTTWNV